MDDSSSLFKRDPDKKAPTIVRGEGIYLYNEDGNRYIDGSAGASNVILGHGRKDIAAAIGEQAGQLAYTFSVFFGNRPAEEYATRLTKLAPGDLNKAYFVSGGSEGIESALKVARQYHLVRGNAQKQQVIARWRGYHGATMGALSLTGVFGLRKPFTPWLADFPHIASCYPYRCSFAGCVAGSCNLTCAQELEACILRQGAENIAAFVCEPVVLGGVACAVPPPDYYRAIREICDRYDILFIADEIITGFGRTGRLFAIEHWDVTPDMIVFGKGASSGYMPLGGVLMRDQIATTFQEAGESFNHIFTYVNNPLAMRVGLEVLDILERDQIVQRAADMGRHLAERAQDLYAHPTVGEVRSIGMILGVELVRDRETREPFAADIGFSKRLSHHIMERGLSTGTTSGCVDGVLGDDVRLYPPLIITSEEFDRTMDILDEALSATEQEVLN